MSFFLALDLTDTVRAEVVGRIGHHRPDLPAKWLRPDKLHLTLRFLGHPTPEALAALEPSVRAVAIVTAPLTLTLRGVGFFATARAPSVLWLGVDGAMPALHTLHTLHTLHDSLQAADDARPFVPHVTLARAHTAGALETLEPALRRRCQALTADEL